MDAKALVSLGDHLFGKRTSLLNTWQDIADNFYVERADFTVTRDVGDAFAGHLSSSYPLQVRRSLGDSLEVFMRPMSLEWFHMRIRGRDVEDQPSNAWLEQATSIMRRAIDDPQSLFARATKEADHDIAAFGQAVLTIERSRAGDRLLIRCWHLRDTAWCENEEGKIDQVHRKWKPTVADLCRLFPKTVHSKVQDKMIGSQKSPYSTVNCRHILLPSWMYDGDYVGKDKRAPFVSIYLDVENNHVMEAVGQQYFMYVIPRWRTLAGTPYGYSPATIIALPDARLLQAMTYTLLEASEKATNPPMIAVTEAIRSDIAIYAGGVTAVDAAYDEREGAVLRPLTQDKSGLPVGFSMTDATKMALGEAFYASKLSLPVNRPGMTAFEVGQWVQQYIRDAMPLLGPLEANYNGGLCETIFELMMLAGAFGPHDEIPDEIRGAEVTFGFESDLHKAIERQKGNTFAEALGLVTQTLAVDPTASAHVNFGTALRDTLKAVGMPAAWERPEEDAANMIEQNAQQEEAAKLIAGVQAGAEAAQAVGAADQALGPEAMAA